ncbi:DUF5004 domain-containing protein [Mucilaginibacter sp. dw_454]|uniref:DUF5004 domain-containing protein n=1 Tax=Mucilaginibacter sp. dw_454 TaxID=2720079 RepID=UPI001BD493FF|nr:DUF5004 domain-containing protein [Mucilaginibacter sp. dw_454]
MKNKFAYVIIPAAILIGFFVNSCKKTLDSDIPDLLVSGQWNLSSVTVMVTHGDTSLLDTTYAINCDQVFTFNADKTCTYTNFDCPAQSTISKGDWELTGNRLILASNIVVQDTTLGSTKPFLYSTISSLGRYSMVLLTGDVINYNNSAIRRVVRYGFVRQNTTTQ